MENLGRNYSLPNLQLMISDVKINCNEVLACKMCQTCRKGCKSNVFGERKTHISEKEIEVMFKEIMK